MEKEKRIIEVFVRDKAGKRVSCGKYETVIDGYVLSVDVPEAPLSIRTIEIEFEDKQA